MRSDVVTSSAQRGSASTKRCSKLKATFSFTATLRAPRVAAVVLLPHGHRPGQRGAHGVSSKGRRMGRQAADAIALGSLPGLVYTRAVLSSAMQLPRTIPGETIGSCTCNNDNEDRAARQTQPANLTQ